MKRMFILAVALLAALAISAQEPNKFGLKKPDSPRSGKYELPDSLRNKFELPDSLAHLSPWKPDYRAEGKMKVNDDFGGSDPEGKPAVTCYGDRQQYVASGTPFHHLERSGLEQRILPRCVPRCADDLDAPAAVGCCCPFRRNADPVRTSFRRAQFPDGSVNWKSPGTAIRGVLQAPIRTGA